VHVDDRFVPEDMEVWLTFRREDGSISSESAHGVYDDGGGRNADDGGDDGGVSVVARDSSTDSVSASSDDVSRDESSDVARSQAAVKYGDGLPCGGAEGRSSGADSSYCLDESCKLKGVLQSIVANRQIPKIMQCGKWNCSPICAESVYLSWGDCVLLNQKYSCLNASSS